MPPFPPTDSDAPGTGPADNVAQNYRAFGLIIRSDVPLPELAPVGCDDAQTLSPDITIVLAALERPLPTRQDGTTVEFGDNGDHYLAWPEVGAFQFRGRDRVEVQPHPDASMAYLAFPLLGPIFGLLLHARGLLVLHGSAIEIDGKGAIFVGDKLAGKSTTAAAFLRAGHRLLTDDLLAVDLSDAQAPRILPAYGQLKLSDEASSAVVVQESEPLPLVYAGFEKRQHRLTSRFQHDTIAPNRLYQLARGGTQPASTALNGVDALQAIMRFSYIARFGKAALPGKAEAEHMQLCAQLARFTQVARLDIPADLDRLDETVALVRTDMAGG
ncbi:hypothetical protein BH10PSE12_BH10PSE12_34720 [soil metagenome]